VLLLLVVQQPVLLLLLAVLLLLAQVSGSVIHLRICCGWQGYVPLVLA
jgi:hypothetical protein